MALLRPGRCCSRRQGAACSIALKLGGGQRDKMRAGRPRSQGMPSRRCGGEWKPGRQAREQGSATIGDVCLSPYRSQPDSSRRNSSGPEGTDSGESPLFITFVTVVTVSSAIADRWSFGGCRAWRLRPCREKGGPDVMQNCNRPLRMDEGFRQAAGSRRADFRHQPRLPPPLPVGLWTGAKLMGPSVRSMA